MANNKIILVCELCLNRNYVFYRSKWKPESKLTIKKYCKHCNASTLHSETR